MANTKFSALNTTTNSDGFLPIVLAAGTPASKINLRDAINAIASGGTEYKGIFDGTTETNLPAGDKGDMYIVSNSGANPETVNGLTLYNGDWIICNTDGTVAGTPANRDVVHPDTIPDASETTKGITQYATLLETEAKIINNKAVVPSALTNFVLNTELVNQEDVLQTYRVQLFFDDGANDLPGTTSTQIDGETISDKDLVYVVDCSDGTKIDKVYEATVVGSNINRTYKYTVGTNSVYSEGGTVYGDKVYMDSNVAYYFSDLYATTVNATDITTENITITKTIDADHYNFQYDVNLVFDDGANSLPLDTSTQIDGQTIVDNNLVYVKDSATPSQIGKIYVATVSGTSIVWTEFATLKDGDTYYSQSGDVYGDTVNNVSETTINNNSGVIEADDFASFPTTGSENTLYVAKDTNKVYRRDGTNYIEVGDGAGSSDLLINTITTATVNLGLNTFNIAKFSTGSITCNLPTAVGNGGKVIRLKKMTGNDTYSVIIKPLAGQSVDGNTDGATFNIDKNQFAFISDGTNRYIF